MDNNTLPGDWLDGKFTAKVHIRGLIEVLFVPVHTRMAGLKYGTVILSGQMATNMMVNSILGGIMGRVLQLNENVSIFQNGVWKEDEPLILHLL